MIYCIIIYLLIGIILVSFCMGVGISQTNSFDINNVRWFGLIIVILFYPVIFLIIIAETIGEWFGKNVNKNVV